MAKRTGKTRDERKGKTKKGKVRAADAGTGDSAAATPDLATSLHVELVKLQCLRGPRRPPINANCELFATGAANLGGALLGAMPAGGGTSQTAVLRSAGGRSQKAALVTAGMAAATMLLLAPLVGLLPHATLAAVVVYSVGLCIPCKLFRAVVVDLSQGAANVPLDGLLRKFRVARDTALQDQKQPDRPEHELAVR
jgi:hypothetical protein